MDMLDAMGADIKAELAEHAILIDAVDCAHDCHDGITDVEDALAEFLGANPDVTDYFRAVKQYHRNQSDIADIMGTDDIFAPWAKAAS